MKKNTESILFLIYIFTTFIEINCYSVVSILRKIEISIGVVSLNDDGILIVKMNENAIVDVAQVKEQHEAALMLTEGKKYAVLIDARATISASPEARAYGALPELYPNILAQAILVNSLANKLMGNFYIKFNKPPVPAQLFQTEKAAMDWLREKMKLI
ncbi:MAG: hypothetical protein ABI199_07880 [Bacteroidia bacterium]